ncbi:MAG: hypothetical protein ABR579_05085 [Actinomycetota bacterium]
MLDRGLAATFRNFATLFFLCAAITVPLHIAYSFVFHNEIGLRELHAQIESFPPLREVKGVSKHDLDISRIASGVVAALELALLPLGVKAARRVLEDETAGDVTNAGAAWQAAWARDYKLKLGGSGVALASAVIAVAVGFLCDRIGILLTEPVSPTYAFLFVGLATGLARAVAAPLFLGPTAYCCVKNVEKKGFTPQL